MIKKERPPLADDGAEANEPSREFDHAQAHPEHWLDLRAFIAVLRRQIWIIVGMVVLGVGAALVYLLLATPQYTATAELLIDTRGQKILDTDQVSPTLDSDVGTIESQVEILRSPGIARSVLQQANNSTTAPAESELRPFMRRLKIERRGLSYVIDVSFTDEDAKRAAEIANSVADAYVAKQLDVKVQATRHANEWLKSRMEKSSKALYDAELRVQEFRSEHGLSGAQAPIESNGTNGADQADELADARAGLAEAVAELRRLEGLVRAPPALRSEKETGLSPLERLHQRKADAADKVKRLESVYGDSHQILGEARAELAAAERDFDRALQEHKSEAASDVEKAREYLESIEARATEVRKESSDRAMLPIRLAELERETNAARELHASIMKRFLETEAQETLQTSDARIISYAAEPDLPSSPKKRLILALALFGSLVLGVAAALARENFARLFGPNETV